MPRREPRGDVELVREYRRFKMRCDIREEEYQIAADEIAAERESRNFWAMREGGEQEPEPDLNWAQLRQQGIERVAAREAAAEMRSVNAANADIDYKAWVNRKIGPAIEEAIEDCRLKSLGIRAPPAKAQPMPAMEFHQGARGWEVQYPPRREVQDDQCSIGSSVASSVASTLTSAFTTIVSVAKDAWDMTKKLWWRLKGK